MKHEKNTEKLPYPNSTVAAFLLFVSCIVLSFILHSREIELLLVGLN